MKILSATAMLALFGGIALSGPAMAQQSIKNAAPTFNADETVAPVGSLPYAQPWNGQSAHNVMPSFIESSVIPLDNTGVVQVGSIHSGSLQSLASLPPGTTDGSPQRAYAQSVQAYFAAQAASAGRVAQR